MTLDFPDDREQMNFMVLCILVERYLSNLLNPLVLLLLILPLFFLFVFVLILVILAFCVLTVSHICALPSLISVHMKNDTKKRTFFRFSPSIALFQKIYTFYLSKSSPAVISI